MPLVIVLVAFFVFCGVGICFFVVWVSGDLFEEIFYIDPASYKKDPRQP